MFNHELYATSFARAVSLLRDRTALKDTQKSALRALVALSSLSSATLRLYDGVLSIDDVSLTPDVPHVGSLVERMEAHGVAEVMLGKGAEPKELLALARALAQDAGIKSVKEHLREAESKKIMVIMAPDPDAPARRVASITQVFDQAVIEGAIEGAGPTDVSDWHAMADTGDSDMMREVDLGFPGPDVPVTAPTPVDGANAPAPEPPPPEPVVSRAEVSPLTEALDDLARDPYGRGILDRLTELAGLVTRALAEDRIDDAVQALGAIVALEPGAPEGTPRNSYSIVLRRTLTREALAQIAPNAIDPRLTEEVGLILRRGRGEAAEVLLGLVANAENIRERRAYMLVLRGMPQGLEQVQHLLHHPQWFVARNVAELMGEVHIEQAVPDLGELLSHADHRVRRAAAVALAKIGTPATVEPLRRAMKEGNAEMRMLVAGSIGRASRALAMPLVAMIEAESDPEVVREYYCALGRIGTGEAVRALVKTAAPGGKIVNRKGAGERLPAIEGLRLAGATAALNELAEDADKVVRDAVQKALLELRKGG